MITFKDTGGGIATENNDEANGEIIGRCNALHDWLVVYATKRSEFTDNTLTDDLQTVCALMGFWDVFRIKKVEEESKEK